MKKRKKNPIVLVDIDGETQKMQLLGRTVREHNKIADRANDIFDKANSTQPGDPNPLTEKEIEFALSTLPRGSEYRHDDDYGWGFW